MAGHAAKKAARKASSSASVYKPFILSVNAVYVLYRVLYRFSTFTTWHALGLTLTSAVYYVCYNGVVEAAALGLGGGGHYFDLLVLTIATQITCLFTDRGWYIYLLVPAYAAYLLAGHLWRWYQSRPPPEEVSEEERARELKRQAKKERKQARGPKMRVAR